MKDTGYFIDSKRQIVGPSGPTEISLNEDEYLIKNGRKIGVYIEDGHFFKAGRWLLFFTAYSPTGHIVDAKKRILGDPTLLPWLSE